MIKHYVARDGKQVSPLFDTENQAWVWLFKHQPMSCDWALQHEGYSFETKES
jgi:hypothetical protein